MAVEGETTAFWAERLNKILAGEDDPAPFTQFLSLPTLKEWEFGRTRLEWPVDPRTLNYRGVVFGGQLAVLADRALALTTLTVMSDGVGFTTSDLRTSFFRAVHEGDTLYIDGNVTHRGRKIIHVEVTFRREDGKLAGKSSAAQAVIEMPKDFKHP